MVMKTWRRGRQSQGEQRDQLEEGKMMQGFHSLGSKAWLYKTRGDRGSFLELSVYGQTHGRERHLRRLLCE